VEQKKGRPLGRLKRLVGLATTSVSPKPVAPTRSPNREELADHLQKAWQFPPSSTPSYPLVNRWLLVADAAMAALCTDEVECPHCGYIIVRAPNAKSDGK
jgi:hypothetical protein